jgi:hypothetical protein
MGEQEKEVRLEGIVRASRYVPGARGKQFLGVTIVCTDGKEWVVDYDEQSPFHAFADRNVVVSGHPYDPGRGQQLIGGGGGQSLGHFRVLTMRLLEVTPDAELVEIGPGQHLRGRFQRGTSDIGESKLSFITENGNSFLVANDPAGAAIGHNVDVLAYAVEPSPSRPRPPGQYLWVIRPCSAADIRKWRERRS